MHWRGLVPALRCVPASRAISLGFRKQATESVRGIPRANITPHSACRSGIERLEQMPPRLLERLGKLSFQELAQFGRRLELWDGV